MTMPACFSSSRTLLEEVERDALPFGELLALDGTPITGGQLGHGAEGVVGPGGDAH